MLNKDIKYIGINDKDVTLFEGQYKVNNGMSFNSYLIDDEKIVIVDTVEIEYKEKWLSNIERELKGRKPSYLIIEHMEPDHSANIANFLEVYPDTTVVGNVNTFKMIDQFFDIEIKNKLVVKDNDVLNIGKRNLKFIFTPMVHWIEVMFVYSEYDKTLFTSDAFGKFNTIDTNEDWLLEARRYYIGICAKYGLQVNNTLKKAQILDIENICPLHGPILDNNIKYYLDKYITWSNYEVEEDGYVICYASVYGNTKDVALKTADRLKALGHKVVTYDLNVDDISYATSDAFKYSNLILASITYNNNIFPSMKNFIDSLTSRNFQNRQVDFIENGSWGCMASKVMKDLFSNSKNITNKATLTITSKLKDDTKIDTFINDILK